MNKYIPLEKRSKKAQKEYHLRQRRTWDEINPITRSVPNGKAYNRKKEKQRIDREFRDEFNVGPLLFNGNIFFHQHWRITPAGV